MHYNLYLWTNRRNYRVLQEIGVKQVDGEVRFQTGSRNMAVHSLCTWLCGRYYVPENVLLVIIITNKVFACHVIGRLAQLNQTTL